MPHPGRTVAEPVELSHPVADQASTYISSAQASTDTETTTNQQRWKFHYIEAGHWPMLTIPDQLTEILIQTAISQPDP